MFAVGVHDREISGKQTDVQFYEAIRQFDNNLAERSYLLDTGMTVQVGGMA